MINYISNLDELIFDLGEELRNWIAEVSGGSGGIRVARISLDKNNFSESLLFKNKIDIFYVETRVSKTYPYAEKMNLMIYDKTTDAFEFRIPITDLKDYFIKELVFKEIEVETEVAFELEDPSKEEWEDQGVEVLVYYLDNPKTQFKSLSVRCFYTELQREQVITVQLILLPFSANTFIAPSIRGFEPISEIIEFEPDDKPAQVVSVEYFRRNNSSSFFVQYKLIRDAIQTDFILESFNVEREYGYLKIEAPDKILGGKFSKVSPNFYEIVVGPDTDGKGFDFFYEEVL